MARPCLSVEEKDRRGTLRKHRELDKLKVELKLAPPPPVERPEKRSYASIAEAYESGVISGRVVACKWVKFAVERQRRDLDREDWAYTWDAEAGAKICHFIEHLPHVEDKWATPLLRLEPWQVWLVMVLHGWRQKADPSLRRFTQLFFEVGRKSAKTTLVAGLAYAHLLEEGVFGAQVVCGATTGAQARIVFAIMQKMGRRSRFLLSRGVQVFGNAILTPDGEVKPVNSKATSLDGLNPSMVVLDESHAQDYGLFGVLGSALGSRGNPLLACPTTAGYDLTSVGYGMHQQAEKVLEGLYVAENLLAVIYTLDKGDDWRDERSWAKASPMLGITPKLDRVREECIRAVQMPGNQGEFRLKRCNEWLHGASRWLNVGCWEACKDEGLRLEQFEGQKCWMGADLAAIDDMAALAFVFERGDELVGFVRCYLPEAVVRERAQAVPEYQAWADDGLLVLTEGNMIDMTRIEADVVAAAGRFKIQEIAFDQYGSVQICGSLSAKGIRATILAKNAPNFTPPARDMEARVNHGKFRHDGNSLLRWAAANVVVTRRTDDSILPKKESTDSVQKIDPIDALLQAMACRLRGLQVRREPQMLVLGGKRA